MHKAARGGDDNVRVVRQCSELLVHAVTANEQRHAQVFKFGHLARESQSLFTYVWQ